jgi:hypothetical protein
MKYQNFIDNYWERFLEHICQFHDIEISILEKYKYDLNWLAISRNKKINWNDEILEKFEDKLIWHELAWNEAITWTTELIEKFKRRLDWYYLGRNINLPISKEFISRHRKNIFIVEDNIYLNKELISYYNKNLLPKRELKPKLLSEGELKQLEKTLSEKGQYFSEMYENLYTQYIIKLLDWKPLQEILKSKFNYSQRYFQIKPIKKDIQGLTPEFQIKGKNYFENYMEGRGFFDIQEKIDLINGSLQEGLPRLYEVPRFSGMRFYPILIVSENLKRLMPKFKIAKHKFIPIKLIPDKLKSNLTFYILQLEYDIFTKRLDFKNIIFSQKYKKDYFDSFKEKQLKKGQIKSYEEIQGQKSKLKKKGFNYSELVPSQYNSKSDLDIFTIQDKIIVNEFVKDEIERLFPNQVEFSSAQLFNIHIPQEKYDNKTSRVIDEIRIQSHKIEIDKDLLFYIEKKARIEERIQPFNLKDNNDKFSKIEAKLEVVFPEEFKRDYIEEGEFDHGFQFLNISDFYINNEYSDRNPQTFNSVIFAENGIGDSLGLILKRESDYLLDNTVYEFYHETGEVKNN